MRVLHQPHRRLLQIAERLPQRPDVGLHAPHRAPLLLDEAADLGEESLHRAAAVRRQLAADQVERLDAVGALVDHGDAGVADELLHAPFGDIAVAAEHLLRLDRIGEAQIGEHAFDHRRHQTHLIVRRLPLLGVLERCAMSLLQRRPQRRARAPASLKARMSAACGARRDGR